MEQILGLPPAASAHSTEIDHSIVMVHYLMLALFLGWSIFYVILLIRFRKSKHPKADYAGTKSKVALYLAGALAVFELVLLYTVDAPLWASRVSNLPNEKDAIVVHVVAEQFAWNIHYPGNDGKFGRRAATLVDAENPLGLDRTDPDAKDDITTINQLNLPTNKPVIVYLTSKDVIHSFNLPLFRVKQDAIPGITVPVWFVPTKTTAEVRRELSRTYSVAGAMKEIRMVQIPQMQAVTLSRGMAMDDMMTVKDYADSAGSTLISRGDRLTGENIQKLVEAGISQVQARKAVTMDKFLSNQEVKDQSGTSILGRNETLYDEALTKLAEAGIREVSARPLSNMDTYVLMQAYNDPSGAAIANEGDMVTDELLSKLSDAKIASILIGPSTPTEIACAQLCGLGHYRMRGYVTVQTPEEYQKWHDEQEAALNPPQATDATTTGAALR